jgi:hypothetical protein
MLSSFTTLSSPWQPTLCFLFMLPLRLIHVVVCDRISFLMLSSFCSVHSLALIAANYASWKWLWHVYLRSYFHFFWIYTQKWNHWITWYFFFRRFQYRIPKRLYHFTASSTLQISHNFSTLSSALSCCFLFLLVALSLEWAVLLGFWLAFP